MPKYKGTLKKWKDDRGFGFIQSDAAEGKDIFVHVSVIKRAKRRPKVGDAILFDLKTQKDGKVCASNALIEGATFKGRSKKKSGKNYKLLETAIGVVVAAGVVIIGAYRENSYKPRNTPRTTSVTNPECNIKGNISHNSGDKVYHVPDAEDYQSTKIDTTRGERWFCTEEEARQNGWRKAPR